MTYRFATLLSRAEIMRRLAAHCDDAYLVEDLYPLILEERDIQPERNAWGLLSLVSVACARFVSEKQYEAGFILHVAPAHLCAWIACLSDDQAVVQEAQRLFGEQGFAEVY